MEVLGVSPDSPVVERLGIAFGASLALDVLVLLFRTSGLAFGGISLLGIDPVTVHAVLVSWTLVLVFALVRTRGRSWRMPTKADAEVFALTAALGLLVLLHFYKYPLFPQFESVDFYQHVEITDSVVGGTTSTIPSGILYYGVHVLMGSAVAVTGDPALFVTQYSMGILVTFSALLVYAAAIALCASRGAAMVATAVYVFAGYVWFGSVFDAGLYANFFGVLAALTLIASLGLYLKKPSLRRAVLYLVVFSAAMFSHYSILTLFPALLALPVIVYVTSRKFDRNLSLIIYAPMAAMLAYLLTRPDLVTFLLSLVSSSGSTVAFGDTTLSPLFSFFPVLRYIFVEVLNDAGTILLLVLAAFGAYSPSRRRDPLHWLCIVWLVSVLALAPNSNLAWRFSFEALVPLTFLAAEGTLPLLRPPETMRQPRLKRGRRTTGYRYKLGAVVLLVAMISAASWSEFLVTNAFTDTQEFSQAQQNVYTSFSWLKNQTTTGVVVSPTNWEFEFLTLLYGRPATYAPLAEPATVLSQARGQDIVYVALTHVSTIPSSISPADPFLAYSQNANFKLVYQNNDVSIYMIAQNGT